MNEKIKFAIIGAGPTGLGAAYRLKELGETNFQIFEKTEKPGGLATSYIDDQGFTWDIGGHVQFSHYKYFDDLMVKALGEQGWLFHERESWAWMYERFVPYPVQNNIRYFPQDITQQCVAGMRRAREKDSKLRNFYDWIHYMFGEDLAQVFMLPYNFKVWAYPAEKLSYRWVGERVAVPDLQRIIKNIELAKDDISWGPNNTFRFPKQGGTGAIWESVAKLIGLEKLKLKSAVSTIDPKSKKIFLQNGKAYEYEFLLSSMPLDILVDKINGLENKIKTATKKLQHSSTNIVGIGLKGKTPEHLKTKCWMYFPENNCPFYRTTVFSNYSPNNVPDSNRYWSLMTETSESAEKSINREMIVEETIAGCIATRLIANQKDIASVWSIRMEHGYPTPSLERDEVLNFVLPQLEQLGIYSRGRFGAWKYEVSNQDHSLMQGVEWVNRIIYNTPEATINTPDLVNSRYNT